MPMGLTENKQIWIYIKNEYVHTTFVNLIFRIFARNDDVKSYFALWGRIEWAGAKLNGIAICEYHI